MIKYFIIASLFSLYACDETDTCMMNADKLGIETDACLDRGVAVKAVKVLDQLKENAKSDAERKLDGMLGERDASQCKGNMADLAAKLRVKLIACESKLSQQPSKEVINSPPVEMGDWRDSK